MICSMPVGQEFFRAFASFRDAVADTHELKPQEPYSIGHVDHRGFSIEVNGDDAEFVADDSIMTLPRSIWTGQLRFGPVSHSVRLYSATGETNRIQFRLLSRIDRQPVKSAYVEEVSGKLLPADQQIRGYETDDGSIIPLEPDAIAALKPKTEHTIDIAGFVETSALDQRYREKSYFVAPLAEDADSFAALVEALRQSGKSALSCVVLYQRARHVVIEPFGLGLLLTTLRHFGEVADLAFVHKRVRKTRPDPEMIEVAGMIIQRKVGAFAPENFRDTYQEALQAMVRAKLAGRKPPKSAPRPKENVVSLMEVLKRSLDQGSDPSTKLGRRKA